VVAKQTISDNGRMALALTLSEPGAIQNEMNRLFT
jgi:hypothetical protein